MSCQIPFSSAFKYAIRTTNNLCGIFAQIRLQKDKLDKKRSHITVLRVKSLTVETHSSETTARRPKTRYLTSQCLSVLITCNINRNQS